MSPVQSALRQTVRVDDCRFPGAGRITWDDEQDGRVPLLVIDGRVISWERFGRMLMSFEGWQFKLEIRHRSEEI